MKGASVLQSTPFKFYATKKLITLNTAINQIAGEVDDIFPVNILIKA